MIKTKIFAFFALFFLLFPHHSFALELPQDGNDLASSIGIDAEAYIVVDAKTNEVLIDKNADLAWTPASLTKLVTALVVLDTKPKLNKSVSMTQGDQIAGSCGSGGACIKSSPGVRFTVDGLFHAALLPSANNAAYALARSTGLSQDQFVSRMNKKAKELGATNSYFYEPTGMDPNNKITASDYSKIIIAAYSNAYLKSVSQKQTYTLRSSNKSKYTQKLKNTDKLLSNSDLTIKGAKTGYLNESGYNFASLLKYKSGSELAVVVLGEKHLYSAFEETQLLARLAEEAHAIAQLRLTNSSPF